jgi:electron transfer DM13
VTRGFRSAAVHRPTPLALRLLAVPVAVAVLLAGLWLAAGVLAPTYKGSFVAGVAWFVIAAIAIRFVVRARPDLKLPLRATFLLTVAVVGGYVAWTTLRDKTVHEDVVTAAPARPAAPGKEPTRGRPARAENLLVASGSFEGIEKSTSGKARLIRLARSKRVKLTITDLDTAPGPDYRVYLAKGRATLDSVGRYKELGGLKGNKGDQQYDVPAGLDLRAYDTVVIWCRAFSVGIGQAPLRRQ